MALDLDFKPEYGGHLFLCYNANDTDKLRVLTSELRSAGMRLCYSESGMRNTEQLINRGIRESRAVLVVITENFFAMPYADMLYLARMAQYFGARLIPVFIERPVGQLPVGLADFWNRLCSSEWVYINGGSAFQKASAIERACLAAEEDDELSAPIAPVQPVTPAYTAARVQPVIPSIPVQPDASIQPVVLSMSAQPSAHSVPVQAAPVHPAMPVQPNTPFAPDVSMSDQVAPIAPDSPLLYVEGADEKPFGEQPIIPTVTVPAHLESEPETVDAPVTPSESDNTPRDAEEIFDTPAESETEDIPDSFEPLAVKKESPYGEFELMNPSDSPEEQPEKPFEKVQEFDFSPRGGFNVEPDIDFDAPDHSRLIATIAVVVGVLIIITAFIAAALLYINAGGN